MDVACTYCGADIPVAIEEEYRPDRTSVGQFCNYAW